jgi:hypothetical protein
VIILSAKNAARRSSVVEAAFGADSLRIMSLARISARSSVPGRLPYAQLQNCLLFACLSCQEVTVVAGANFDPNFTSSLLH